MDYPETTNDYIVIKAESPNTQVIGMTRGVDTRPHHTEMIDKGEVIVLQFTDKTSFVKIRGNATIYTKYGIVTSEKQ